MIVLFTDFGLEGPYIGQVKAVLWRAAPAVPVIDLFADLPPFRPREASYLLAAYADAFAPGTVFLCVVDPGVGGDRPAEALLLDGRWFVGPGNGLFEPLLRRSGHAETYALPPPDGAVAASFHGRDLFAPAAGRLARGMTPAAAGFVPAPPFRRPDWPDDLPAIVYVDRFGNLMTGMRRSAVPHGATLALAGRRLTRARTFSDLPEGQGFWYENANGLVEIAVNQGRADRHFAAGVGDPIELVAADG